MNGKNDSTFNYIKYVKPMIGKMLRGLNLDISFTDGEGNWLEYVRDGKKINVLDFTGGYGANLLGHKNPEIVSKYKKFLDEGPPFHTQGSIRKESTDLATRVKDILKNETGSEDWISHFSNSGTESVETAIKLSQIYFKKKVERFRQKLNYYKNMTLRELPQLSTSQKNSLKEKLSEFLGVNLELESLIEVLHQHNLEVLFEAPYIAAVEGSFHGKTLGSLGLIGSESFKKWFFTSSKNFHIEKDILVAKTQLDSKIIKIKVINPKSMDFEELKFSRLAAVLLEPIQGEGGILSLSKEYLEFLKSQSEEHDFLLVSDEIQSGMFRTGTFASLSRFNIKADIYTFSKALGGGLAKIGLTVISNEKYIDEFGFLHTSTFGEDAHASFIANCALDILTPEVIKNGMDKGVQLKEKLNSLVSKHPTVIKEIRGEGLLLGIEFRNELGNLSFETKLFSDQQMVGYFLFAVLFNREKIRLAPSLSNEYTLRVEPSIFTTDEDIDFLIKGISNLCEKIENNDGSYLMGSIFKEKIEEDLKFRGFDQSKVHSQSSTRPLTVFLCHLIDPAHTKIIMKSTKEIPDDIISNKIYDFNQMQNFSFYYRDTLWGKNGEVIDIGMLAIPITSFDFAKSLSSRKNEDIVLKIQDAIDFVHDLGATTVGLGQFTSIVSRNGLFLDPKGMNLTTGNSLTTQFAFEAALKEINKKNLKPENLRLASVGCSGNIMSILSSLATDYFKEIVLVSRQDIENSKKLHRSIQLILKDILESDYESPCVVEIKKILKMDDLKNINRELINKLSPHLRLVQDLNELKNVDVIICGTSSSKPIIFKEHIKENTIIIDVSVPPNVDYSVREIDGVELILGGTATLPERKGVRQSIQTPVFPLKKGECFACMGETFTIGLTGKKGILNIGHLDKKMVREIKIMSDEVGINLGTSKKIRSL